MHVTFAPNGHLQLDDVRICYRNFKGAGDKFTKEGDRSFSVVIPDEETADRLRADVNRDGVGWNVKTKPPRDEDSDSFSHLKVKVKFNGRGPNVYLITGDRENKLTEETIRLLDDIEIENVNLDIRPYDDIINGKPFRSAYLHAMEVYQRLDRFSAKRMYDSDEDMPV